MMINSQLRLFFFLILFASFSAFIHPAAAEEPSSSYRIKAGDVLLIAIYGEDNTQREVTIGPSGTLSYLYLDPIPALGRTIEEVREELSEMLRKYYRFFKLLITPVKFNAEYYTIAGQVNLPGRKPIVGRPTVLSALCQAQGFQVIDYRDQYYDLSDLDKTFLARQGSFIPVDFTRLVQQGDLSQDIPLEAGDYIFVPRRDIHRVYVLGEVLGPKPIEYFTDISLVEAVAEAGGITEFASSRVVVIRGSLACPMRCLIDYPRIVKGYDPNFPLLPGDIVYVPARKLYLIREIVRIAIAAFINTVAGEAGIEAFILSHPDARGDFSGASFIGGNPIVP